MKTQEAQDGIMTFFRDSKGRICDGRKTVLIEMIQYSNDGSHFTARYGIVKKH